MAERLYRANVLVCGGTGCVSSGSQEVMSALTKEEQVQLWTLLAKIRERAMQKAGIRISDPFPPSDPNELH